MIYTSAIFATMLAQRAMSSCQRDAASALAQMERAHDLPEASKFGDSSGPDAMQLHNWKVDPCVRIKLSHKRLKTPTVSCGLEKGSIVRGGKFRYRVKGFIKKGCMNAIYHVEQFQYEWQLAGGNAKSFALKTSLTEGSCGETEHEFRFLNHMHAKREDMFPEVVETFTMTEGNKPVHCIVMELLTGYSTLRKFAAKKVDTNVGYDILKQICEGISTIHEDTVTITKTIKGGRNKGKTRTRTKLKFFHGDLHWENIMINANNRIKIIDPLCPSQGKKNAEYRNELFELGRHAILLVYGSDILKKVTFNQIKDEYPELWEMFDECYAMGGGDKLLNDKDSAYKQLNTFGFTMKFRKRADLMNMETIQRYVDAHPKMFVRAD